MALPDSLTSLSGHIRDKDKLRLVAVDQSYGRIVRQYVAAGFQREIKRLNSFVF